MEEELERKWYALFKARSHGKGTGFAEESET